MSFFLLVRSVVLKSALRAARNDRVFVVYFVLDNPAASWSFYDTLVRIDNQLHPGPSTILWCVLTIQLHPGPSSILW